MCQWPGYLVTRLEIPGFQCYLQPVTRRNKARQLGLRKHFGGVPVAPRFSGPFSM